MKIAAAYIRVSTEDQTELSPDSQLTVIRDYARKNGYLVPEEYVYVDAGISGRSAAKRPGFTRMVSAAREKEHPFETILVWKFSRFARNQEESIVYKAMLRKDGVDVVSVSEPLVEGPFGSLIERILEWMDEYYSIRLSGEVRRSMTLNAQRGNFQSNPPYGYIMGERDGKRGLVPDPAKVELVREMYRRYLAGDGLIKIAKWLNAIGERTQKGKAFSNRTVEYILRNPVYIGKLRWTPGKWLARNFDDPDAIIADGEHEAIVEMEVWERVQERNRTIRSARSYNARPPESVKHWLSGVVRCSSCGGTLVYVGGRYFRCGRYNLGKCRSSQNIRVDKLEKLIMNQLRADMDGGELEYVLTAPGETGMEVRHLEAALDQVGRKLERIRESYIAGIDSLEDYRRYKAELDRERDRLMDEKGKLMERESPEKRQGLIRGQIERTLETLESDVGTERRNAAVKEMIDSCVFDKGNMRLSIVYRFFI